MKFLNIRSLSFLSNNLFPIFISFLIYGSLKLHHSSSKNTFLSNCKVITGIIGLIQQFWELQI